MVHAMKLSTTLAVFFLFLTVGCRQPSVAPGLDPQEAAPRGTIYLEPGQTLLLEDGVRYFLPPGHMARVDGGSVTVLPKEEDNRGK